MKKASCLLLIFYLFCSTAVSAQEFEVPYYTLDKAEDYSKHKEDILDCIEWLEKAPLDKQTSKRKEASAFLLKWAEGSPLVSIEIHEYIMDVAGENSDMLMLFMGGWSRYELQNPSSYKSKESKDIIEKHFAGTKSMLLFYEKNKKNGIKKSKTAEKLLKMSDAELRSWLNGTVMM